MDHAQKEIVAALADAQAVFVRPTKHGSLFQLPNGRRFTVARFDQGGRRASRNTLRDLRHALAA